MHIFSNTLFEYADKNFENLKNHISTSIQDFNKISSIKIFNLIIIFICELHVFVKQSTHINLFEKKLRNKIRKSKCAFSMILCLFFFQFILVGNIPKVNLVFCESIYPEKAYN